MLEIHLLIQVFEFNHFAYSSNLRITTTLPNIAEISSAEHSKKWPQNIALTGRSHAGWRALQCSSSLSPVWYCPVSVISTFRFYILGLLYSYTASLSNNINLGSPVHRPYCTSWTSNTYCKWYWYVARPWLVQQCLRNNIVVSYCDSYHP